MISNLTKKMSDVCRLCLQAQESLTSIFDTTNLESFKIQLLIRDLCSIKLIENDSFPKCICSECKTKLFSIHEFITQCKESDNKLHRMFGPEAKLVNDKHHSNDEANHTVHETNCTAMNIKQEAEEKDPPEYPVSTMLTVYDDDQMVDEEQQTNENQYRNRYNNHYTMKNPYHHDQKVFATEETSQNAGYQQCTWNLSGTQQEDQNRYGDETLDEAQLFGKDWPGEEMVKLHDDVYCRKSIYDAAHVASHKASHVARRLISGVFKPEAIRRCTLTGQTPRTLGKERLNDKVDCLHVGARNAIIDYSRRLAEERGWKPQSIQELKHALSQRLGELKREMKSMELHQMNVIKLHSYYNSQVT